MLRKHHEAAASIETYSPAEEMFNRRRRTIGLVGAPIVMAGLLAIPMPVTPQAHRLSATLGMMVVLWITEALPLAVTALLGPLLAVMLRVAPMKAAFAPFADPIIFLFIGSFMLAEAMFVHGLDRRMAFGVLSLRAVGTSPLRILVVYGGVAAAISMWISNTATAAMMFPIGLSIVAHLTEGRQSDPRSGNFAIAMMLVTAFGVSIGGLGTPIGSPPNLIGIGMLSRIEHVEISFFKWMTIGVPLAVLCFSFLVAWLYLTSLRGLQLESRGAELIRQELRALGPLSPGQRNVLVAFGITVALWLIPGFLALAGAGNSGFAKGYAAAIPESGAALTGAILLFLLPVSWRERKFTLSWDQAVRIDWGIILLFGGGLAMGELAFSTGLAESLGRGITEWLPVQTPLALTVLFTGSAILMTEMASNTACANMIVPIAIAVSEAAGVNPLQPALGATLGASMAFMLPISTPPNAIIYSSGHVPITTMMKHGFALDVASFVLVVTLVTAMRGFF